MSPPHIAIQTPPTRMQSPLHQDKDRLELAMTLVLAYRYRLILAEVSGTSSGTLSPWGGLLELKLTEPQRCYHPIIAPAQCCQSCGPLQRRIDSYPTPLESGLNLHPSNISFPLPDSPSSTSSIASTSPTCPPPARAARFLAAVAISPDAAVASCPPVARDSRSCGASSFHALRAVIYQSLTARSDAPPLLPRPFYLEALPRRSGTHP